MHIGHPSWTCALVFFIGCKMQMAAKLHHLIKLRLTCEATTLHAVSKKKKKKNLIKKKKVFRRCVPKPI